MGGKRRKAENYCNIETTYKGMEEEEEKGKKEKEG